jgi:hypothetical protein
MPKRRVHVVEVNSDKVVHSEDIVLDSLNEATAQKEFEDIAWTNAKSDGHVPRDATRAKYKFTIQE